MLQRRSLVCKQKKWSFQIHSMISADIFWLISQFSVSYFVLCATNNLLFQRAQKYQQETELLMCFQTKLSQVDYLRLLNPTVPVWEVTDQVSALGFYFCVWVCVTSKSSLAEYRESHRYICGLTCKCTKPVTVIISWGNIHTCTQTHSVF